MSWTASVADKQVGSAGVTVDVMFNDGQGNSFQHPFTTTEPSDQWLAEQVKSMLQNLETWTAQAAKITLGPINGK